MKSWLRFGFVLSIIGLVASCARLHHVMLSDVEGRKQHAQKIDLKVSETTVDFKELAKISKDMGKFEGMKNMGRAGDAIETYTMLFQFGPSTGAPVFNPLFASAVPDMLQAKCPGGRLSDIVSIREAREYYVVKGEFIRIQALCISGRNKQT